MLLSIIIPVYNVAPYVQKCLASLLCQGLAPSDYEVIVVNDGSTDESYTIAKTFLEHQASLSPFTFQLLSQPNGGLSAARNKGIRMAKGEYLHFLNSGDWLVDEHVVEKMLCGLNELIDKGQKPDIFVGNKIMVRPDGKVRYGHNDKRPVTALTFYRGTIEHTSAYIRRALFDRVGLYDETFRIVSDYKWYFDAVVNHNAKVAFTDIYVSYFDNTGISSTNLTLDKAERRQVLEQMLPPAVLADYDTYSFDIDQMQRLKRYPLIYKLVWFAERILFKFDKWNAKYWSWKKK